MSIGVCHSSLFWTSISHRRKTLFIIETLYIFVYIVYIDYHYIVVLYNSLLGVYTALDLMGDYCEEEEWDIIREDIQDI